MLTRKIFVITILVSIAAGFGGGFVFLQHTRPAGLGAGVQNLINQDLDKPDGIDFSLFWRVWSTLHEQYVDKKNLKTKELLYGAVEGMVNAAGDPYTVFFPPTESKKFEEDIAGAFSGVGMEIGKRNGVITVVAPLKDSPAMKAGLKSGDQVLEIDGTSTADFSVDEAVKKIRGPKGSKVMLTVSSDSDSAAHEISIIRDVINVPSVEWRFIDGDTAYIELSSFSENLDREFKKAAEEIVKSSAKRIILDLRGNPGGLLNSSVTTAGWLLAKNSLVTIQEFGDGTRREFRADGNAALREYPLVVLINGGSASASEILAGALHDNRNVPLVGEKSFGKGSVQELEKFSDGSSLKVTIAKWLTPNGVSISETGIKATSEVDIDEETFQKDGVVIGEPGKDPQLDKAIEIVNNL